MARQDKRISQKKRGRPATGKGTLVAVRIQPQLLKVLDKWRDRFDDLPTRPEAIRRLVELGLKAKGNR